MQRSKLKVEYRPIAKLKPYANNANIHPPEQVAKIKASIERFGWTNPILVDGKNGVVAGHGRLQAALQMQERTVPVIELHGLSAAEKRAYVLADNRIAQDAGWDKELLRTEFGALTAMGMDLNLTGFDKDEIEGVLSLAIQENPEPPVPALPEHAVSKKGDVWLLGEHRLLCGDATKAADWDALTAGERLQLIFTDPPYGVSYEARSGTFEMIKGDDMRRGQLARMLSDAFHQAARHTLDNAAWYVWHASATREDFAKALRDQGLVELGTIIWAKPAMVLGWSDYRWSHEPCLYCAKQGNKPKWTGDRTQTTVWRVAARTQAGATHVAIGNGVTLTTGEDSELYLQDAPPAGRKIRHVHAKADEVVYVSATGGPEDDVWEVARDNGHGKATTTHHPTQKPVELARRAIGNSTEANDGVGDMFGGSGSTLIAAEQLQRRAFVMELDPRYVDIIVKRWQDATGKAAKLERGGKTFEAVTKDPARRPSGKGNAKKDTAKA